MNQAEWKKSGKFKGKYTWYNKTRKLQRSLQYNSNPSATIIHHLRDTEDQRKYNDEHYEYWGFNQDGTFEYGKYVIFVTEEWHYNYHRGSAETNYRKSCAAKRLWLDSNRHTKYSERLSGENNPFYGKHHTVAARKKMSEARKGRFIGENHPMYGRHHLEESKIKISISCKGKHSGENNAMYGKFGKDHPFYGHHLTDDHKLAISKAQKGRVHSKEENEQNRLSHLGKHHSEESKQKISATINFKSMAYKMYKSLGGELSWNDFQKIKTDDYIEYGISI